MGNPLMRGLKNIWGHGDEDDYGPEENEAPDTGQQSTPAYDNSQNYNAQKYASSTYPPAYSGGSTPPAQPTRRPRPVPLPLRAREKNIYTLKPKSQDEAAIAADYLKTGSAVVLNLEDVDAFNATRIIDFMSGVCYGLDGQGHAMKLGETIFLFTPAEFEISSDETDYGENQDFFFKDVDPLAPASAAMSAPDVQAPAPPANPAPGNQGSASAAAPPPSFPTVDRFSWER